MIDNFIVFNYMAKILLIAFYPRALVEITDAHFYWKEICLDFLII